MPIQTTYTQARANLASLWDEATRNREIVIIERRGSESVALISVEELEGLLETATCCAPPRMPSVFCRRLPGRDRERESPKPLRN